MVNKRTYIKIISVVLLMGFSMCGDVISKVATSAGNWLKLETDARAIGMGGAYVAMYGFPEELPFEPPSF